MIRLNLNENPYIIPKLIREKINLGIRCINEYPSEMEDGVIQKISEKFGVNKLDILLTQGIDEAMDRLIQQFSKMRFVIFNPTFDGYISRLKANNQDYLLLKLDRSFKIRKVDIKLLTKNDFVILANPNNPTGNLFEDSIDVIRNYCGKLLIDETYFDFSNGKSYLNETDNRLFIFRSFSKAYSLAGLRLGWLCGDRQDVEAMKDKQWFCNINTISLIVLFNVLEQDYFKHNVAKILREKEHLMRSIDKLGFEVKKTKTNFFLIKHKNVKLLIAFLYKKGISVKDISSFGLDDHVRISVGLPKDNIILLKLLKIFKNSYEKK